MSAFETSQQLSGKKCWKVDLMDGFCDFSWIYWVRRWSSCKFKENFDIFSNFPSHRSNRLTSFSTQYRLRLFPPRSMFYLNKNCLPRHKNCTGLSIIHFLCSTSAETVAIWAFFPSSSSSLPLDYLKSNFVINFYESVIASERENWNEKKIVWILLACDFFFL